MSRDRHPPFERSPVPPRNDVPVPDAAGNIDFDIPSAKHPSDYHADCAMGSMIRAHDTKDTLQQANELKAAEVYATLSLRDAVLEWSATVKEIAKTDIAATEELSATMKKAANVIYAEVRRATVKPATDQAESA